MFINELPYHEQENLTKIAGACLTLKDRVERHGFKVLKFQVTCAVGMIGRHEIYQITGIETIVKVDGTLPAGTINVAVLVQ